MQKPIPYTETKAVHLEPMPIESVREQAKRLKDAVGYSVARNEDGKVVGHLICLVGESQEPNRRDREDGSVNYRNEDSFGRPKFQYTVFAFGEYQCRQFSNQDAAILWLLNGEAETRVRVL